MGGSRASASEIRQVQAHYSRPDSSAIPGSSTRPSWLWGWVTVYVLLGILALVLMGMWISANGGVAWGNPDSPNLMFNYHVLFMVLGFVFLDGMGVLVYRVFPAGSPTTLKVTHGTIQLTAFIIMCCGAYAVGYSKDYARVPHVPRHFVSIHSWCGIAVLTFMALQWVCGFFGLLVPGCKGERRQRYRSTHIFTGNLIYLLGSATVLLGLDELSNANSTLNTLALTVVAYAILGAWFLSTDKFKRGRPEHVDGNSDEREPLTTTHQRVVTTNYSN